MLAGVGETGVQLALHLTCREKRKERRWRRGGGGGLGQDQVGQGIRKADDGVDERVETTAERGMEVREEGADWSGGMWICA